eukprot:scaffold66611_cov65-Phaeocystis_antarctica.AAC.4
MPRARPLACVSFAMPTRVRCIGSLGRKSSAVRPTSLRLTSWNVSLSRSRSVSAIASSSCTCCVLVGVMRSIGRPAGLAASIGSTSARISSAICRIVIQSITFFPAESTISAAWLSFCCTSHRSSATPKQLGATKTCWLMSSGVEPRILRMLSWYGYTYSILSCEKNTEPSSSQTESPYRKMLPMPFSTSVACSAPPTRARATSARRGTSGSSPARRAEAALAMLH